MKKIQEIYKKLDWNNPVIVQQEGLRLAETVSDLSLLIMPPAPPSVWEHCASVISRKTDAELSPYLDGLLGWLQDLNWPGAQIVVDRLNAYQLTNLAQSLQKAIEKAQTMSRLDGFRWLDYLSELLDNKNLTKALPDSTLTLLQKHYHNWGYWY